MKTMKRFLLAASVSLALALTFTACGSDDGDGNGGSGGACALAAGNYCIQPRDKATCDATGGTWYSDACPADNWTCPAQPDEGEDIIYCTPKGNNNNGVLPFCKREAKYHFGSGPKMQFCDSEHLGNSDPEGNSADNGAETGVLVASCPEGWIKCTDSYGDVAYWEPEYFESRDLDCEENQ
jgi:hypothetical protein